MIYQLQYNTKLSETLNNSKDYCSMQNTKWVATKPNQHRMEYLQFTQRNKPHSKYPQDMLFCLISKGLVPIQKQKMVNFSSNDTSCNHKDITSEIKQEHPYFISKLNSSISEVARCLQTKQTHRKQKTIRSSIRAQSKDKDPIEISPSKSCKLISPMTNQTDQKRIVHRLESKQNNDKVTRTSYIPFIQKTAQNDNLTSRSGSPTQRSKSKTNKIQKQNNQSKLTHINEVRSTQHHQDTLVQQSSNQKIFRISRKECISQEKEILRLQTTQQQQILQQQNSQIDKLNQKHTSYR